MDLSVVIPTLNGRQALPATLSSIAERASDAEVIVANGPSADGTSGFVCSHQTVDTLLDLPDRNLTVARNAGLAASSGDTVAFLGQGSRIESTWLTAVERAIDAGVDAVTGPIHRELEGDVTTESLDEAQIGSRAVRFFDGGNVVFDRSAIEALDGFDEGLEVGAARDAAHRLAAMGRTLHWEPEASVLRTGTNSQTPIGTRDDETPRQVRSKGYRLAKNYGLNPYAASRLVGAVIRTGGEQSLAVLTGDAKPSEWVGIGRKSARAVLGGVKAGLSARRADRSPRRNPHGISTGHDRTGGRCDG